MDMDHQKPREEHSSWLSTALKIIAAPLSLAAGYWFTSTAIRNNAYDNAKFMGAVDGVSAPHRKALKAVGAKANQAIGEGRTFDLPAAVKPLFDNHRPNVTQRLKNLELGSLRQQWGFTSEWQKKGAIMNGISARGITLGALFSVANSKMVQDAFEKSEQDGPSR